MNKNPTIRYDPVFADESGLMLIGWKDAALRLGSLASWLEQLSENDMLVSPDETICYADNPHHLAKILRVWLPASGNA